jgi:catechol 2,3-dioxygenase-like lactoylglutathione lyase family enzyme
VADPYAADPGARPLREEEIGHSPIFSPRIDGPFAPNPTVAQGRTPRNPRTPPDSLRLAESDLVSVTLNCLDLERQRAWYERMFGMTVIQSFHRDGVLYEYLLSHPGGRAGAALALAKEPRPPGYNNNGRLGFDVPDAQGLAEFLAAQGALLRVAIRGRVYFVIDPEGNPVEFFTLRRRRPPDP